MADVIKRTEELVTPILDEHGFELYDVEFIKEGGTKVLRVYIDKDGGITSDDTADVCRSLSDIIDEQKGFIDEAYTLEVSSPGITRVLKRPKHFSDNIGSDVEFKLYKPITYEEDGKKLSAKEFVGILKDYIIEDDKVVIGFNENQITVKRDEIASIRLWVDF